MSDNPYYKYLESLGSCYEEASNVDLTNLPEPKKYFINERTLKVVLLAPHPDDECVMRTALRLYREAGCRVVTLPVTMGSNPNRNKNAWRNFVRPVNISDLNWKKSALKD